MDYFNRMTKVAIIVTIEIKYTIPNNLSLHINYLIYDLLANIINIY